MITHTKEIVGLFGHWMYSLQSTVYVGNEKQR